MNLLRINTNSRLELRGGRNIATFERVEGGCDLTLDEEGSAGVNHVISLSREQMKEVAIWLVRELYA